MKWSKTAVIGLVAASLVALQPTAAEAKSRRQTCLQRINSIRANHGVDPVKLVHSLSNYAQGHSREMADENSLSHSNLPAVLKPYGWSHGAENIAYGNNVFQIHRMFMDSPAHRNTILNDKYERVGCGSVRAGGWLWLTEIFYG